MCRQHESGESGAQINFSTFTAFFRTDYLRRLDKRIQMK